MSTFVTGPADVMLAPVAIEIDARLAQLGLLTVHELMERVALESDTPDWTPKLREEGLLSTVQYLIDCHNWHLSWDPRGLRLAHGQHHIVLGVPLNFPEFLSRPSALEHDPGPSPR